MKSLKEKVMELNENQNHILEAVQFLNERLEHFEEKFNDEQINDLKDIIDSQQTMDAIVVKNSDDIILMKKKKEENKESIKMLDERISIIDQDIKAMTTNLQNQLESLKDEVTENDVRENEEGKGQVKCKYFNSGFCRMQENCIFSHKSLKICDAHKNGIKCRNNSCNERHPKVCRYFVR